MTDSELPSSEASGRRKPPGNVPFSSDRSVLGVLLVFTLVIRGTALWAMRGNLEQDPDAYREIAENLLVHGEFALGKPSSDDPNWQPRPTAYRPPLYPVVLSNLPAADGQHVSLVKVTVLHLVLGVATVWLTWATARRLLATAGGTPGLMLPPLVAGLIIACDPILLNQQTLIMTETLAAFLAILSLWCLARFDAARTPFNAAMTGGAIGLAVLCRPTFLPWLGLVAVAMGFLRGSKSAERGARSAELEPKRGTIFGNIGWRLANVVGLIVITAAVISPWVIRNCLVFGLPIMTTTHGGYTLLLGNNKSFYGWLARDATEEPWKVDNEPGLPLILRRIGTQDAEVRKFLPSETKVDSICYNEAVKTIAASPARFAHACAYRLLQLGSPLPHKLTADESMGRRLLRYATCAWYSSVYALAAIGIWRLRWKLLVPPWLWGMLLCLAFTAIHAFYWTNLRMRAPLMPFVAMVAAAGVGMMERRRDRETERA